MAYEKHDWQSGDIIYASQLNEMDEQIKKNEEEQTSLSESITDISDSLNRLDLIRIGSKIYITVKGVVIGDGVEIGDIPTPPTPTDYKVGDIECIIVREIENMNVMEFE